MSASRPALAPKPADANELHPGIWPASARRDAAGTVAIGGVTVAEIQDQVGTPAFVLDEDEVRSRARRVLQALSAAAQAHGTRATVYYAGKAFLCAELVRWMMQDGLNVDVCSGGELALALAAGADPSRLGFHGNNKSVAELDAAVEAGVGSIIVDSEIEVERLTEIAAARGVAPSVMVRVNTGVHAETHDFLATAHEDQKFGIPLASVTRLVAAIRQRGVLRFSGLHAHIGSQIFGADGFRESAARLIQVYAELAESGPAGTLNLGGGFGIAYRDGDNPPAIETLASEIVAAVAEECIARGVPVPALAFEPGRIIVGPAGVTLYQVGTVKPVQIGANDTRLYVSVDGGMSDNARPALYGAEYVARIVSRRTGADPALTRVVGKHCESGDIVVDADYLPADVAPGDLLAVPATGAYCHALASNYNFLGRPPVVSVRAGRLRVLIRRETIADILSRDLTARDAHPSATK